MHQNNQNTFKGFHTSRWHHIWNTKCLIFKNWATLPSQWEHQNLKCNSKSWTSNGFFRVTSESKSEKKKKKSGLDLSFLFSPLEIIYFACSSYFHSCYLKFAFLVSSSGKKMLEFLIFFFFNLSMFQIHVLTVEETCCCANKNVWFGIIKYKTDYWSRSLRGNLYLKKCK